MLPSVTRTCLPVRSIPCPFTAKLPATVASLLSVARLATWKGVPVQSHIACPSGSAIVVDVDDVVVLLDVLELVLLEELVDDVGVLLLVDEVLDELVEVDVAPRSVLVVVVGPGTVELVDELVVTVLELEVLE